MGNYRQTPLTNKDTTQDVNFANFTYSSSSMCGWRKFMEDAHITQHQLSQDPNSPQSQLSLFAIFDGHGGPEVAIFCERHFVSELKQNSSFKRAEYEQGLRQTFFKMDQLIRSQKGNEQIQTIHKEHREKQNAEKIYIGAGATANVVLLTPNQVYCANAGDARSVALVKGKIHSLSQDHKPTDKKQTERVKKAGGVVTQGRVNGVLAVSRAIGDFDHKDENIKPAQQAITADPDIQKFSRQGFEFIIMGCDGLWQVHNNEHTVNWIQDKMTSNKSKKLGSILQQLIEDTYTKQGQPSQLGKDNISTILIRFNQDSKKENFNKQKVYSKSEVSHQNPEKRVYREKMYQSQLTK